MGQSHVLPFCCCSEEPQLVPGIPVDDDLPAVPVRSYPTLLAPRPTAPASAQQDSGKDLATAASEGNRKKMWAEVQQRQPEPERERLRGEGRIPVDAAASPAVAEQRAQTEERGEAGQQQEWRSAGEERQRLCNHEGAKIAARIIAELRARGGDLER